MTDPLIHIIMPGRSKQHTAFQYLVSYDIVLFQRDIAAAIIAYGAPGTNNNFTVPFNGQFRVIINSKLPSFESTKAGISQSIHESRSSATTDSSRSNHPPLTHCKSFVAHRRKAQLGKSAAY